MVAGLGSWCMAYLSEGTNSSNVLLTSAPLAVHDTIQFTEHVPIDNE